ncbi:MAG: M20/M25/M40 family metallo-hydrolase [Chloroflexi bacterium]|nr:M20/M25/M40 family metallo-hydrolase [Chloroflexota bacterium]
MGLRMKSELESIAPGPSTGRAPDHRRSPVSSARDKAGGESPASPGIDCRSAAASAVLSQLKWDDVFAEAESILRRLIQFETVNPPGNERPAADYLAELLRQEGFEPEIFEGAPTRANLVCRLKGTGEKPPLQLDGHLDVVCADESQWTHPPFAADVAGGYIWGRGALDMKQMVTMSLVCMLLFKRLGVRFKRDIIFTAVADEETGGTHGAKYLVDNHADRIRAEYCLGEIGGFGISKWGKTFYPVQVAEKGLCWFELVARGEAGHSSIPDPDSSLIRLSEAIIRLGRNGLPRHDNVVAGHLAKALLASQRFPTSIASAFLLHPRLTSLVLNRLVPESEQATMLSAMLHNTASPTTLRAGGKTNIIPAVARVEVDGRFLPGQTAESFLAEVKDVVGPGIEINVLKKLQPTTVDPDDPIMGAIARVLKNHDPQAVALPVMISATTNATHYSTLNTKYFGFSPVKVAHHDSFRSMFHGADERIPVEGFRFGIRVLAELVEEVCS